MWLYLAQVIRGCGCFFLQKNYSCSVSQRNLQHVRLIKLPAYTSVAHPTSSTKSVVKRVTLIFPREKIDCIHVTLHRMWAHAPAAVLCVCVCRVAVETWSLCTHELVCVMESKWLAFFTWIPIPHFTHVRHVKSVQVQSVGKGDRLKGKGKIIRDIWTHQFSLTGWKERMYVTHGSEVTKCTRVSICGVQYTHMRTGAHIAKSRQMEQWCIYYR